MPENNIGFRVKDEEYNTNLTKLLEKMISLDKEGREITAHAEDARIAAEEKVVEQVKAMREEFKERTKNRLEITLQDERNRAEAELNAEKEKAEQTIARLDALFDENGDKWADEIFEKTVG